MLDERSNINSTLISVGSVPRSSDGQFNGYSRSLSIASDDTAFLGAL